MTIWGVVLLQFEVFGEEFRIWRVPLLKLGELHAQFTMRNSPVPRVKEFPVEFNPWHTLLPSFMNLQETLAAGELF